MNDDDWKVAKQVLVEEPPKEPVVPCLMCGKDFVWWLHPVQLCDDCVALEYARAIKEGYPNE